MSNTFAIDLGCASIKIAETDLNRLRREPSVVAIHKRDGIVVAVGEDVENEAILALKVLGYTQQQIVEELKEIDTEDMKVEEIIKKVLFNLNRK